MVEKGPLKFPFIIIQPDMGEPYVINDNDGLVKYLDQEDFNFTEEDDLRDYDIYPLSIDSKGVITSGDKISGYNVKFTASYSFKVK